LERPRIDALVGSTLTNVAIAIIIERCVRFPDGRAGKILNLPSVRYVGVLSYSIYLWQQLFLNREGQGLLTSFPLNVAMTIAASLASYYLIERRFLEFRRSYELRRRRSRPSADVAAATAPIPAATPPAVETTGGTS
jgi:peptidoglycan/LPS O-acetylase OafA/YrhL